MTNEAVETVSELLEKSIARRAKTVAARRHGDAFDRLERAANELRGIEIDVTGRMDIVDFVEKLKEPTLDLWINHAREEIVAQMIHTAAETIIATRTER